MTWGEAFGWGAVIGGSLAVICFPTTIICWLYVRVDQTMRWVRGRCRPHCRDWKPVTPARPGQVVLECRRCKRRFEL